MGSCRAATPPPHPTTQKKEKLKKNRVCIHDDINVLRDVRFSRNQAPKSADEYMEILKNKIKNYEYIDFFS
jgi:hypothetical protein